MDVPRYGQVPRIELYDLDEEDLVGFMKDVQIYTKG